MVQVELNSHTIGASYHNLERILILPKVCCLVYRYRRAPERAFVVGRAGWIWAILGASIQTRVAFNVHVEGLAARYLIALRGASEGVVAGEGVESHVIRSRQGGVRVNENNLITIWSWCGSCHCLETVKIALHDGLSLDELQMLEMIQTHPRCLGRVQDRNL